MHRRLRARGECPAYESVNLLPIVFPYDQPRGHPDAFCRTSQSAGSECAHVVDCSGHCQLPRRDRIYRGVGFFAPGRFWWWSLAAVVGILAVPYVIARSYLRLRVHRWEFNEVALYVQTGWITHVRTIIPIQRIKKITEQRGLLQRKFGLSSLTISAGSGAGTINIDNIDHLVAAEIANKSAIATAPDTDE